MEHAQAFGDASLDQSESLIVIQRNSSQVHWATVLSLKQFNDKPGSSFRGRGRHEGNRPFDEALAIPQTGNATDPFKMFLFHSNRERWSPAYIWVTKPLEEQSVPDRVDTRETEQVGND
jgi:hypothetical protein